GVGGAQEDTGAKDESLRCGVGADEAEEGLAILVGKGNRKGMRSWHDDLTKQGSKGWNSSVVIGLVPPHAKGKTSESFTKWCTEELRASGTASWPPAEPSVPVDRAAFWLSVV